MKSLYFDCSAGASGDMLLGALLDILLAKSGSGEAEGDPCEDKLLALLSPWTAQIEGVLSCEPNARVALKRITRSGVPSLKVDFFVGEKHADDHHGCHRTFRDIRALLEQHKSKGLSSAAYEFSIRVFEVLAQAEAKAHGSTPEDVHFHEVGAFDSIMDIVGFAAAFTLLAPECVYSSGVTLGSGVVNTAHGVLSVPPPAVEEILKNHDIAVSSRKLPGECLTPTGAAILAEVVDVWDKKPSFVSRVFSGVGAGTREQPEVENVVRSLFGESRAVDSR